MKRIIILICFLLFIDIVYSSIIEVGVAEVIEGKISSLTYDNSSNIVKFLIEFYNTGSVPYKARMKIEVFNNSKLVFNGWSQEKDFMPGEKKLFEIYWYSNNTGNYSARVKAYFGNEIKKYKKFNFSTKKFEKPEDVFEIKNFRTYDNYIIFDIQSKKNAKNVIIIPYEYKTGWIFEQKRIDSISENSSKLVLINYYPTLWIPSNVTLEMVSDNGKYYTEKTIEMKKNKGLIGFFYYLIDSIRIALFS